MKVVVITPVGPGHEAYVKGVCESVRAAWEHNPGPFDSIEHVIVDDTKGELGRSRARNRALDQNPADWHFLLDADDVMLREAFPALDPTAAATFGAVCLDGRVRPMNNVWPLDRDGLIKHGPRGTLAMGCFVAGELGLRFDESMDLGEDFDFYMRLPSFTKRAWPIVSVGYSRPSAHGPRGYRRADWWTACERAIARYTTVEGIA